MTSPQAGAYYVMPILLGDSVSESSNSPIFLNKEHVAGSLIIKLDVFKLST